MILTTNRIVLISSLFQLVWNMVPRKGLIGQYSLNVFSQGPIISQPHFHNLRSLSSTHSFLLYKLFLYL